MTKLESGEQQNAVKQIDRRFQQQQRQPFARNDNNNKQQDINSFTNINFHNYQDYRDEEGASQSSSSPSSSSSLSDDSATSASSTNNQHASGIKKNLFNGQKITNRHHHQYSRSTSKHKKKCSEQVTFASVLWRRFKKVGLKVMKVSIFLLIINFIIYYWPIESPEIETKISAFKPRPKFAGPLAINNLLDSSETLFLGQFHAPESMAWKRDKRSFYTGVEGGFILFVEPYKERWQVVAKLNARNSIYDQSNGIQLILPSTTIQLNSSSIINSNNEQVPATTTANISTFVPKERAFVDYCTRDVELYGKRAEFEPQLVSLSRCSRPLGIRLSPDETYLYVNDAFAGLFRIDLVETRSNSNNNNNNRRYDLNQVTKLIDYTSSLEKKYTGSELDEQRLFFSDDIAVDWGASETKGDIVYMTDCSRRWNVRFLIRVILENDDTGRVLAFNVNERTLKPLETIVPTLVRPEQQYYPKNNSKLAQNQDELKTKSVSINGIGDGILDWRNLSFPNGVELTSNKSALLISDLNNRRIIMHHLKGMLKGQSVHLLWVPGFSDNVRRGLDDSETGEATYWTACGCAVEDGYIELTEFLNDAPILRRLFLKFAHIIGSFIELLGSLFSSTNLLDAGLMIKSIWLKKDPYCTHGIVIQFNEQGKILRSLHAPHFQSNYKLLSEAHQVPLFDFYDEPMSSSSPSNFSSKTSALYLGSVYYSYLGRVRL